MKRKLIIGSSITGLIASSICVGSLLFIACSQGNEPMQSAPPANTIDAELDQMFTDLGARMTMRFPVKENMLIWRSNRTEDSAFPIFTFYRPGKNPHTGDFELRMLRTSDSHDSIGRREYSLTQKKGVNGNRHYILECWEYDWDKQTNYGTVLVTSVEDMELAMTKFHDRIDQFDHESSAPFADEYHTREAVHEVMQGF